MVRRGRERRSGGRGCVAGWAAWHAPSQPPSPSTSTSCWSSSGPGTRWSSSPTGATAARRSARSPPASTSRGASSSPPIRSGPRRPTRAACTRSASSSCPTTSAAPGCRSTAPARCSTCPRPWSRWSTTSARSPASTPTGTSTARRCAPRARACCGSRRRVGAGGHRRLPRPPRGRLRPCCRSDSPAASGRASRPCRPAWPSSARWSSTPTGSPARSWRPAPPGSPRSAGASARRCSRPTARWTGPRSARSVVQPTPGPGPTSSRSSTRRAGRTAELVAQAPTDAVVVHDVPLLVEKPRARLPPRRRGPRRRGRPGCPAWFARAG